jgi:Arc/MetJ-type ribon-helix-helix transcriptional regulator
MATSAHLEDCEGIAHDPTNCYMTGMKINLSLPARLHAEADAAAKDLGVSRSKLVRTALEEFLNERRNQAVAESVDRHISEHGNELGEEDEAWISYGQATEREELKDNDGRAAPEPKNMGKAPDRKSKRKRRCHTK